MIYDPKLQTNFRLAPAEDFTFFTKYRKSLRGGGRGRGGRGEGDGGC